MSHRIFATSFSSVYELYVKKVERKGRSRDELDAARCWLTGFSEVELADQISTGKTIQKFFADARLNPNANSITGVVCGVRVEDVADPLMQKIRYMDKLVDELAKGRPLAKVTRTTRRTPPDVWR